ncbi:MAG: hypothetical protein ACNA8L_05045 [Luteolibacter sp.]
MIPLLAAIAVIGQPADWTPLSFRGIPPMEHAIANERIVLTVKQSAGGIVRPLPKNTHVKTITIRGRIDGQLKTRPGAIWLAENDDALLRVGLIHAGGKPLNRLQRVAAPAWIRTLDDVLCAGGRGPARIDNLLLTPHAEWIGKSRQNPNMKQLHERFAAAPKNDGTFTLTASFEDPIDALGLWLMADGDDTKSTFTVTITAIELTAP